MRGIYQPYRGILTVIIGALALLGLGQTIRCLSETKTVEAASRTVEQGALIVTGTVIRQELVIEAPETALWQGLLQEGQRAAAGETLFESLPDAEKSRQERLLSRAYRAEELRETPLPERRGELLTEIAAYNRGAAADTLSALLLSEGAAAETIARDAEAAIAESGSDSVLEVTAPEDGVFSYTVDGMEGILTPETAGDKWAILPAKPLSDRVLGKLITSDTWYFAAVLTEAPEVGEELTVSLDIAAGGTCRLQAERVARRSKGWWVLFSCGERVEAVAGIRELSVKILSD